jgi:hypothetical protein
MYSRSFIGFLPAVPKVLGITRAHVGALEMPYEDLDEVIPAANATLQEVLQPGPCGVH